MTGLQQVAMHLAGAMLGGTWSVHDLSARATEALGKCPRWLPPLCRHVAQAFASRSRPPTVVLADFIASDATFLRAWHKAEERGEAIEVCFGLRSRPVMNPRAGAPSTWPVPHLTTPGQLAAWLEISPGQLDWLADRRNCARTVPAGPLRNYRYRWVAKRAGGTRLIEIPKERLKHVQQRVLHGILDQIPPHESAHGFCRGRSLRSFVLPHVDREVVVRVDLRDFFTSIARPHVLSVFLTAGYPEAVARLLSGLCTSSVPDDVWQLDDYRAAEGDARQRERLRWPHLPQGAPTSPALANLCAYPLDCRLQGLARSVGANYTRYADDLVFSGDGLARCGRRLTYHIAAIAMEERFAVHPRKTGLMRQSVRQHVAGVVVNKKTNVRREDFDRLKAILHNCQKHGPASQNRAQLAEFRAHLAGRIEHVRTLHPRRGERLRQMFGQIVW